MSIIYPEDVIIEYITTYITDDYNLSSDMNWININSVFDTDSRYRLGFNIPNNFVHDFKTGQAWSLEKFVSVYQEVSNTEARNILMRIYMRHLKNGIKIIKPKKKDEEIEDLNEITIRPEFKELSYRKVLRNNLARKIIIYIMNRGLSARHILKYRLKFSDQKECYKCHGTGTINGKVCDICKGSKKNPYYGWLIIPFYENNKLVYYTGRNIDKNSNFRYRNPKNIKKSQIVGFYDLLKEKDRIFITEGPMDAMTLYDYSVACILGNRISIVQAKKLMRKKPKEIIFIPDYDETEDKRIMMSKALLKNIETILNLSSKVKIGIYQWYKKYKDEGKDLNDLHHIKIEEDLILYKNFKNDIISGINKSYMLI